MAAPTHYLKKRDTLHSPKATPQSLAAVGQAFFAQEAYSDALDFFEKARDLEGLRKIKQCALQNGDSFLLARLARYDAKLIVETDWEKAIEVAEQRGIPSMAAFARKKIAPEPQVALPGEAPLEEKA